ncbi:hypothetical protein [Chitinophaga filiformis]|uniref:Uncharacterized protein n=1 Tax=Chitinophaga filiformis TaxID=104663 RepID=A0A1G7LWG9_CHIFI|nr:hypothetical protein [Chitinophaga filiformis]SDF53832.1 hypothetical protein SAMN04488121_102212 [Chitinophaga filiformis]
MKKIKLLFAILAVVAGVSGAVAANHPSSSSSSMDVIHDWIDWNDQLVLTNATQAQAQTLCSGSFGICLRAKDNTAIYTVGELPAR